MTNITKAIILLAALHITATIAKSQELELAPLPVTPTAERLQAIASLSPFAEATPHGMLQEDARKTIGVFMRQGRWPILVEYEDGSKYWGEVSEIGANNFKLLNRKTNQEEALSYAGIGSVELVRAYGASLGRHFYQPQRPLSPEQASYRIAVQKLGVDKHRFVHVDLPKGKVRTGVITRIEDRGFMLKDGILNSQWISFTDLQATPRPVSAVGTRIGQGFKWVGLGLGMVAVIPLIPLWAIGMSVDGGGC